MSTDPSAGTNPLRIAILNQYYVPDVASTGHLLSELGEYLTEQGDEVSVLACWPSYGPPETWQKCPSREVQNGIYIRRMKTTRFTKNSIIGRTINSLTFLVQLTLLLLFRPFRKEVFLYTTNPPYLPVIGALLSFVRKQPYVVLLHDSYPQLAVLVGKIKGGSLLDRLWHKANKLMYKRAKHSIVLCRAAQRLVCDTYDIPEDRVSIVHNWADPNEIKPKPKTESDFAREHGLIEPFTVLYSGNLGLYYEFGTIIDAAEILMEDNFRLVFIGAGGNRDWIAEQIESRNLHNTTLLPYQPFERLPDSLTACDASLVTIQKGVEGISYPSKLYASMSTGRPILGISEPGSELQDQIVPTGVGLWSPLGDAEGLAEHIRTLIADPEGTLAMGRKAREVFEEKYTRDASAEQYQRVFQLVHDEVYGA